MTENHHILTPEAAKEKWCPLSMANAAARYKCQGDQCLAWRWADIGDEVRGPCDPYKTVLSDTHGQCGMVPT